MPQPDWYNVGLKLFITRGDTVLGLTDPESGNLDLPGGRINGDELRAPFERIIAMEVKEELGPGFKYGLSHPLLPVAAFRIHKPERKLKVFLVGFHARWLSGEPVISYEHSAFEWVPVAELQGRMKNGGFADGARQFREWFARDFRK
ncbi:hypothetical protein HY995_03185 [Candidatus Micrarchaeota archaeon]|nr:hypothetical protein [Candidatus Micrarchaeota archaeon]